MISCSPRRPMQWNAAIGAIARCKRVSTGCGRKHRSVPAWPWICGVKPRPKGVNKPSPHSIVHGLDKPGVFTTVSRVMGLIVPTTIHPEREDQPLPYEWCVGIDWGSQQHQVSVLDRDRRRVGERVVDHDGASLARLADWLWTLSAGQPQRVAVAIEVPRSAIVEGLLERGFHLFALNPKQLDRFRDRHSVAGAKDDRRDAFVLADSVRTDQ